MSGNECQFGALENSSLFYIPFLLTLDIHTKKMKNMMKGISKKGEKGGKRDIRREKGKNQKNGNEKSRGKGGENNKGKNKTKS